MNQETIEVLNDEIAEMTANLAKLTVLIGNGVDYKNVLHLKKCLSGRKCASRVQDAKKYCRLIRDKVPINHFPAVEELIDTTFNEENAVRIEYFTTRVKDHIKVVAEPNENAKKAIKAVLSLLKINLDLDINMD